MSTHIHVIPIPVGMESEEAWAEIVIMGKLTENKPIREWAIIKCNGEECKSIDWGIK